MIATKIRNDVLYVEVFTSLRLFGTFGFSYFGNYPTFWTFRNKSNIKFTNFTLNHNLIAQDA